MLVLDLTRARPVLANATHRASWRTTHHDQAHLRELARLTCLEQRVPELPTPVVVTLLVTPPDRRRRDLDGYAPTLKRLLDGVVAAGVLPDDSPDHVAEVRIRQDGIADRWRLQLHIDPDQPEQIGEAA